MKFFWTPFRVLMLVAGVGTGLCAAQSFKLSVSDRVAGATPSVLGYTLGHLRMETNSSDWLRYTEVDGFRVWSSVGTIEASDDLAPWGDGVEDLEGFQARRAALRADPESPEFINWSVFEKGYASETTSSSRLTVRDAMEFGREYGLTPLVMIHRGANSYPFADSPRTKDWKARWELWQHYYAQAFWLARYYDVTRFQLYNEPDHRVNDEMSQTEYIERLKLASDAVQCALRDVNRIDGKSLVPHISAPVTVAGVTSFHARGDPNRSDQRDFATGWGELVMRHRRDAYFSEEPDFTNFQTYTYHQYGKSGPGFGEQLETLQDLVAEANGGEPLPFTISEFNVLANYQFRKTEDTMHTPAQAARLGSILVNLVNARPDELYLFKFGQTEHSTEHYLAKNGTFWQDNDGNLATGGSTRGGEVYRLFVRGFRGGQKLLEAPHWSGPDAPDVWSAAALDEEHNSYHLMLVSESETGSAVELNLSAWDLARPGLAILEEVSQGRQGTIRSFVRVPSEGPLKLELSPESVWLLTIPRDALRFATVPIAEDASVFGGRGAHKNRGSGKRLHVAGDAKKDSGRSAAYLKFDLGELPVAEAKWVLLRLHLRATSRDEVLPAHLYGIADTSWSEGALTAATAPNLHLSDGVMLTIDDNRVTGQGETAFIQGTVTALPTAQDQFIDVTRFVRSHADSVGFMITQEVRYAGELRYDGELEIMSKEAGPELAPQLIILY